MNPSLKKRVLLAILLFWLLPALACNFPTRQEQQQRAVSQVVQQTMQALFPPTAQPLFSTPAPTAAVPGGGEATQPGWAAQQGGEIPSPTQPPNAPPAAQPAGDVFNYASLPGDTLPALLKRFGVEAGQVQSGSPLPPEGLIPPGTQLRIPNTLGSLPYGGALLPDSEIVNSPSAAMFDLNQFIDQAGGYLSGYTEVLDGSTLSGAQVVQRVVDETSINPRILLAALEFQAGWVYGQPRNPLPNYPLGFDVAGYEGLYKQLILTQRQLTIGYYGWRAGTLTELNFQGDPPVRIDPRLNAGTVAVQYLFQTLYKQGNWVRNLYGPESFTALHTRMFGDPWVRAAQVEPLLPAGLQQPALELPFQPNEPWNLTGGPHAAWGTGSPRGGIDLAPMRSDHGCVVSGAWVTASAPGVVVRSGNGVVMLDLDGDGHEQTGWDLMYMHIATKERVPVGTRLNTNDRIGHPSCEGGVATGTHTHLARKYNGEWLAADGPVPFVLGGWQVHAGALNYQGSLTNGDQVVTAQPDGSHGSLIYRN